MQNHESRTLRISSTHEKKETNKDEVEIFLIHFAFPHMWFLVKTQIYQKPRFYLGGQVVVPQEKMTL